MKCDDGDGERGGGVLQESWGRWRCGSSRAEEIGGHVGVGRAVSADGA